MNFPPNDSTIRIVHPTEIHAAGQLPTVRPLSRAVGKTPDSYQSPRTDRVSAGFRF